MPLSPSGLNDVVVRLTNVDLNLIPPLLALLQEQSVTQAAERVGLSQPAMSHTLARLRKLLKDDLLVRSGTQMILTPRAILLRESLPEILRAVTERVLHAPDFDPATDTRRFILSMTTSTAYIISPLLLRITEKMAPKVSFEIRESAIPGSDIFGRPDLDLALVADTVATSYSRTKLYDDRWVGVADESNPLVSDELTKQHLAALPHVAYQSPTLRLQPYIALMAEGIEPRFDLVSSNFLLIPLLIGGTRRVAIVQERLAKRLAGHTGLKVFNLPFPVPPLGIDVVWNPRLIGDSATTWLVDQLRRELPFSR